MLERIKGSKTSRRTRRNGESAQDEPARWRAALAARSAIEKQHGKGALMVLGEEPIEPVAVIPTGSPGLDRALGCGGYPRGRLVEIYGAESSGKTTLTLHAVAECQRAGGVAAFVDAEHALDLGYARALGVQVDRLMVAQPDCGEQALDIVDTLVRSEAVDLVVVDSVAALVPRAELEGEVGDQHVGLQARLMARAMRKLTGVAHRGGATLVFVNQTRMKIGVSFGSPETTPGGQALKFHASVRLEVRRVGTVKSGEQVRGHRLRIKVVKNKLAPPFRTVELDVRYGEGIDVAGEWLDRALALGVVERSGAFHRFEGEVIGQGRERARSWLLAESARLDRLRAAVEAAEEAARDPSRSAA